MNFNFRNNENNVCITHTQWQEIKRDYHAKFKDKKNQHVFCWIFVEGRKKTFSVPQPQYPEKMHTEEIVIGQIEKYLDEYDHSKTFKGGNIVMYSTNSPCMKRENGSKEPCMFQLLVKAKQWHSKFEISTTILFKKFWGPIGSNYFKNRFLPQRTKNFSMQLGATQLRKRLKDENMYLKKLKNVFENLAQEGKKKKSYEEHLQECSKVIKDFTSKSQEDLTQTGERVLNFWTELLKSSLEEHNRAEITERCNSAIVKNFLHHLEPILGEGSPIQFCQIDQM